MASAPDDLRAALLAPATLIDVRAPVEFAQGALPGSINLCVLDDAQRAAVGLCYRREGAEAAGHLGRRLVSGDDLSAKLTNWAAAARSGRERSAPALLYCFRGGLRSQSVQAALGEIGEPVDVLAGGYKRARRFLLEATGRLVECERFAVLGGFTGCGKTVAVQRLAERRRAVDLEGLARHRGSAFGGWTSPQPSQADFENLLALALWKENECEARGGPIVLEDESRMIGRAELPPSVYAALSQAPLYVIESPIEERARFLVGVYLNENYGFRDGDAPEGPGGALALGRLRADLLGALTRIERRLGGAEAKSLRAQATAAIDSQAKSGSFESHHGWAERLLAVYYDPLYRRHLLMNQSRIIHQGPIQTIYEALGSV